MAKRLVPWLVLALAAGTWLVCRGWSSSKAAPDAVRPVAGSLPRETDDGAFAASARGSGPRRPIVIEGDEDAEPGDPLEPRVTLGLRVIDGTPGATTEGEGIPFARVQVDEGAPAVVTDAQGFARLPGLLAGEHALRAWSERYARFEQVVDLRTDQGSQRVTEHSLVVRLNAVVARVSGLVIGPDGAPIAGALVCLDTRTRESSGNGTHARPAARAASALTSPPHAVTDQGGAFELEMLAGFPDASLLVCPVQPGTPLVVRRPLDDDEQAGLVLIEVDVPAACSVQVRCQEADGSPGRGSLELSDGIVTYDLTADAVLGRVLGAERWNDVERQAGGLDLRLAPGGYKALFRPEGEGRSLKAFYLTVSDVGPQRKVLSLEGG